MVPEPAVVDEIALGVGVAVAAENAAAGVVAAAVAGTAVPELVAERFLPVPCVENGPVAPVGTVAGYFFVHLRRHS